MSATPDDIPAPPTAMPACSSERILSAAADLGTLVGVKLVTVRALALRADVPEEALNGQWNGIGEIMTAAVARDLQNQFADIEAKLRQKGGLDEPIVEAFTSIFWFLDGHPLVGGTVRSNPDLIVPGAPHSVHAAIGVAVHVFVDTAATVVQHRAGSSVDTEPLSELIVRLVESLLLAPTRTLTLLTRADTEAFARRCILPAVQAFCRPGGDVTTPTGPGGAA